MAKKRLIILILIGMIVVVLLIPFRTTIVPEWEIQVVDLNGEPVAKAPVKQEWSNSEILGTASQTLESDENGKVVFPTRYFFAPLLVRGLLKGLEYINNAAMPHGSRIGVYSRVICERGTYYWLEYRGNGELEHTLVVRKLQ